MSLLDDPALGLRRPALAPEPPSLAAGAPALRVRFLPTSVFARDFGLAPGAIGEIRDRYTRNGWAVVSVWIEDVGFLTGVPADEVEAA